ncbi:membrane protein required for colicin V production [Stella humosa]|uniref:Membrane protein required for colicin V production n=1 Tax=Stella humosa TaxID=94 RepID=A0A3N1MC45_9PROT|nr:CvpA family protein [Stella humosa]ROQ01311.1 membrane protein required for colicin V production [Stella humosa]BBK31685.1 colicin V biosynthesis protein [Stella humosa]
MNELNYADLGIAGVILLSALFAVMRGFVREVLSVAGWIGAGLVALYGFTPLRGHARDLLGPTLFADIALGAVLFLFALIVFSLITHAIANRVRGSALSAVDRTLGLLFGIARGAVLVCLAYLLLAWAVPAGEHPPWIRGARALPLVQQGATWLTTLVPKEFRDRALDEGQRLRDQARDTNRAVKTLTSPPIGAPAPPPPGYSPGERRELDRTLRQSTQ